MKRSIWASAVAFLFFARSAAASPPYPALIGQEWSLKNVPACTLCHATLEGGTGTVVTYFGRQLQAFGLRAEDESSLADALARDKAEGIDSDGDGVADFDSLSVGMSPNAGPGPKQGTAPAPEYGCSVSGNDREWDSLFGFVLAVSVIYRAKRKRSA